MMFVSEPITLRSSVLESHNLVVSRTPLAKLRFLVIRIACVVLIEVMGYAYGRIRSTQQNKKKNKIFVCGV